MTNPKKKPANKPAARARVVYEVRGPQGTKQVDAATTAELKTALTSLLKLEPYSVQAAAHLAHTERATVTGQGWSIKRLGVLAFVPDTEQPQRRKAEQSQEQSAEQPQVGQRAAIPTADIRPQLERRNAPISQQKLPDDSEF